MAGIAILVLVGLRFVPDLGYAAGITDHASRSIAWSQPKALEDSRDAVPEVSTPAFHVALILRTRGESGMPSLAMSRPPTRPIQHARSHLERAAASVATPTEPF